MQALERDCLGVCLSYVLKHRQVPSSLQVLLFSLSIGVTACKAVENIKGDSHAESITTGRPSTLLTLALVFTAKERRWPSLPISYR